MDEPQRLTTTLLKTSWGVFFNDLREFLPFPLKAKCVRFRRKTLKKNIQNK